jgi:hypothetical protein
MKQTIYLNVVDKINNINFTFDLTPEILDDTRRKKHNLTVNDLVGGVYKSFKKKDFQLGASAFTHYLLKTESWKVGKMMNQNCFNFLLEKGQGYGYIKSLFIGSADNHEEAHNLVKHY